MEAFAYPVLEGKPGDFPPSAGAQAAVAARTEALAIDVTARAREEGLAAGLADAATMLEPVRTALAAAITGLDQAQEELAAVTERRAVELAIALAEKILHAALDTDPALVTSVVTGALRRTQARDRIVLELNPEDIDAVRSSLGEIEAQLGGLQRLELTGERRVSRGGCVVRTVEGEIDATIDGMLSRAAELLRDSLTPKP